LRDSLLLNVSYRLLLSLSDSLAGGFSGSFEVSFDVREIPATKVDLFLDF